MKAIYLADLIGTFAFCITGIIGGIHHRIDLIGALFLAFVSALGGGIIRDAMLGVESSTFHAPCHLSVVLAGVVFTYLFIHWLKDGHGYRTFVYLDALGLAVFTVIGVEKAISLDVNFLGCIVAGTITAVGGGVIRDTLIGEIPFIFHKEIYAASSLLGGLFFYWVHQFGWLPLSLNTVISITLIFGSRVWGYHNDIHMPRFLR